jgi:hypothetical protein
MKRKKSRGEAPCSAVATACVIESKAGARDSMI